MPSASSRARPARTRKAGRMRARTRSAPGPTASEAGAPKHEEKVTFYCTRSDLVALESARLRLRAEFGIGADRGRIVRAALAYVLDDFEARGKGSVLLRQLKD